MNDYSYENADYAAIREAARGVTGAYGAQNKWLDTIQEGILIDTGMQHVSDLVHGIAHRALQHLDEFSEILHQRHLMTEYPATAELDVRFDDLGDVFDAVLQILGNTAEKLEAFRQKTETPLLRPLAIATENLMVKNSEEYTLILKMWKMWEKKPGYASFDNWVLHLTEGGVG